MLSTGNKKDDPRMGDIIIPNSEDGEIVIVGFPQDEGVKRNGGRLGSSKGPEYFRKYYMKLGTVVNPEYDIDLRKIKISDHGDIHIEEKDSLEDTHQKLETVVTRIIKNQKVPFVMGGGNDQSYPNGCSLLSNYQKVGIINIDAHFDVRPLIEEKRHSGSPFRQLLEDPRMKGSQFYEFAAQGNQCSNEHAKYLKEKGSNIVWLKDIVPHNVKSKFSEVLQSLEKENDAIFVSFDLDSVSSNFAPGVSAPGTIGISSQDALDICFLSGSHPKVKLFDLSEFNPLIEGDRTARLVTNMFYFFSMGYTLRKN